MDFFDFIVDDQNDKSLSGKGERQFETTPLRREENKQVAEEKLLTGLNPEQQKVVRHSQGPLLVLAGAGSGKTMAITHRIAWLLDVQGVSPYEILAITFTNKAAGEMRERVGELIGTAVDRMWIGTFHAMFARLLRYHADLIGYDSTFTIIDSSDQLSLVRQILKDKQLSEERYKPQAIVSHISNAKNQLQEISDYERQHPHSPFAEIVADVWSTYQRRLVDNNAMDFDDILTNTVKLLTQEPEVLSRYQDRFRYILVDEYQDTNYAQYEAVRLLAAGHKNICVVGDDDQSIYSFRGADVTNILNFEKDYDDVTIIRLEQNYRSTKMILEAANHVIANNQSRKFKKLWTAEEEGEQITYYCGHDQYDEARFIADEINRRVRQSKGALTYRDFAVLYRANVISRNLEGALRDQGIPYRIYGGQRFYDRREIKDIIAYLRLVVFPGDDLSFERVINTPKRGIGTVTLDHIRYLAQSQGLTNIDICRDAADYPELSRAARRLRQFYDMLQDFHHHLEQDEMEFADYIEYIENESGLVESILEEQEKNSNVTVDRIENLKELLSDAQEFSDNFVRISEFDNPEFWETDGSVEAALALTANDAPPTLHELLNAFLEQTTLYSAMDMAEDDNTVSLMTIHSAKGLEFPIVFLAAAEESIFPSYRAISEPQGEEEERRLAYVAITRAEKKFYVTSAEYRMLYGRTQYQPVSRFVKEIPESCMEVMGAPLHSNATAYGAAPHSGTSASSSSSSRDDKAGTSFRQKKLGKQSPEVSRGTAFLKRSSGAQQQRSQSFGESSSISLPQFTKGMRVVHKRFGSGTIIKTEPIANDILLMIRFDKGGEKPMLAKQAPLRKE